MRPAAASYRISNSSLGSLIGGSISGSLDATRLEFVLSRAGTGNFVFQARIVTAKRIIPGMGAPVETLMWGSTSTLDANGSISKEITYTNSENERSTLTVSLAESAFLGSNKVISFRNYDGQERELMVGPDDVITTLFQIAVFAGSLDHIPVAGVPVRWVSDGMPYPLLLKRDGRVVGNILAFKDDPDDEKAAKTPFIRLHFQKRAEEFGFPEKISFSINKFKVDIIKEEEEQ
jgi:hypothetical protein